ncbi:glycerol kinase GlpK [Saccharospirillum salsuginis]|uniref:Glycerol kinase n=1 Tax=Saccharospirillum salsuginis TaxID=418750 RepID=A0A918KV49_9GAMM|nr:glycerol kinase GlpK [Saccharospirillum salsuginis]GGX74640.1 glycerol kinase 1 [Saccharospirillum salsuginis]
MTDYLLAIDQGTTSTRTILFNRGGLTEASAQEEFEQHFPADGWVEHNPEDLWRTTLSTLQSVLESAGDKRSMIRALGMTNQRETTLVWDRQTGEPVYNAIVWQDRRTARFCDDLRRRKVEGWVHEKTGLLLDPYFSASKIRWILDNVDGVRERAQAGRLMFGTVDTYLIWKLTGGKRHVTDASNASRTLLFNIHTQQWDSALLDLFDIPMSMMPTVLDSASDFGTTDADVVGAELPIAGVAGDQQAALFGQCCFDIGMTKSTYGTGCFMVMNTGVLPVNSRHRLLTTVGYRLNGQVTYALEGSIFMAGATLQWLRDQIGFVAKAADSEAMAERVGADQHVYLVPAFTGLGAPHWDPNARAAIVGMTRDTGIDHIVTAGLQSVGYQTADLLGAMLDDGSASEVELRIDGGMAANDWAMQFLSDVTDTRVTRPVITETTALGAAMLAGLQVGVYQSTDELSALWQSEKRFEPAMDSEVRERLLTGWRRAVKATLP